MSIACNGTNVEPPAMEYRGTGNKAVFERVCGIMPTLQVRYCIIKGQIQSCRLGSTMQNPVLLVVTGLSICF